MNRTGVGVLLVIAMVLGVLWQAAQTPMARAQAAAVSIDKADKLFEDKNYKEAAEIYEALLKAEPRHEKWQHASERVILCKLRLQLFDDALAAGQQFIARTKDTPYEARSQRLTGNLYMLIPHWGTRAGGEFHRAQWLQGIRVRSYTYDKSHALAHMERARDLYAKYDGADNAKALEALPADERAGWHNERLECLFDLAGVCGRFGIYENQWSFWYSYWGERDDQRAETAGERDFDEYYSYWQLRRQRPIGLRIGPDAKPMFPVEPKAYGTDLSDDQKILYLLSEIRSLDQTENKRYTGASYYRQAMLARARFGMDRLNSYAGLYWEGTKYPLQEDLKSLSPWELKDSEALVLAGGQIRKVTLPKQWDVLALLRVTVGDYAKSGVADEALYGVGLYYQTRQQYVTALGVYDRLKRDFAGGQWANNADTQITRIKAPQVQISQTGVQLPGEPVHNQISYRNTSKVWFVARRLDLQGFLTRIRDEKVDPEKGHPYFWALQNWASYFVYPYNQNDPVQGIAAEFVGDEVARWSHEVKDDGTYRYAEATLATPLSDRGAYMVYAYVHEPPADDAKAKGREVFRIGQSRAVVALTDLAIVDKKSGQGNLYYICDARSGAPVPKADVKVLEVWSTYNRAKKRSIYHRQMHEITTDDQGIALLKPPDRQGGTLHVLVTAGDEKQPRLAWSGMSYWSYYRPSQMRDGLFAYCITDRPVYRPNQRVRYKIWLRHMAKGLYENQPDRSVTITIYDARGNKIEETSKQSDQFGGLDGEFTLGDEPALGMYQIRVASGRYLGGQNFRVEEYKKPEFEVSVEPGKTHARLGEKVSAVIKADYYFGAPVTDAQVQYKVYRQEYTHQYYFPGQWDWLYGPGYGYAWYAHDWFPWWRRMRCCWSPPGWWWGYSGYTSPNPVRELVQQGESAIGADGTLKVEIDTAAALRDHPDRDHLYVVEAEVRDASRRVISGQGAVKVTRQAYYAMVQADRGYYRPGEEMLIKLRCLTPDNKPVQTQGVVTISQVVFGAGAGNDNARLEQTQVNTFKAATNAQGEYEFRLHHEKSCQLQIKFAAPDEWGGVVEGYALVWVVGQDFNGKLYRFNNLELITDKRTYQPGETAHVMINTAQADSYVLFSDDVDNGHLVKWKLLHLTDRHMVVDVPVKRGDGPNFFIEATTVADTRLHQQATSIAVPPEDGVLNVSVTSDKPEYRPGQRAEVDITATTLDGKPASAQVTLSAFDRSVLYIQDELTPDIARFFHGNTRSHTAQAQTNLLEQFAAVGNVAHPYQQLHPVPDAWYGIWGPSVGDWRSISDAEMKLLIGANRQKGESLFRARRQDLQGGEALSQNAAKAASEPGKPQSESRALRSGAIDSLGLDKDRAGGAGGPGAGDVGDLVEAAVRKKFADTAAWLTTLTTDEQGKAHASFEMPENLTTWKINAWAMGKDTRVGQADTAAVTTKNLIVRLQAPRFFVEYDQVVISANVHNYLATDKVARVSLDVGAKYLKLLGGTPASLDVKVPAGGEKRIDWSVRVVQEGTAAVTVKALTDEESDAMQMAFPVLVHGITKQVATTGSMRPDDKDKTLTMVMDVPQKRRPELTRLEVQYSPSLVGAMIDALPYCLDYPYGCTEQTMSRFLPAVLTLKTLQSMGIKLEDVKKIRGRLAEIRRIERGQNITIYGTYADSPVFDTDQMNRIIKDGLGRIANMQNGDGGWGWWTGNRSDGYLTSYVLYALTSAQQADVAVDQNMVNRGMQFLRNWEQSEMQQEYWAPHAQHAFAAFVLSHNNLKAQIKPAKEDQRPGDLIERLWADRDKLPLYGKALLTLTLANLKDNRAATVLQNIMQFKEENAETQVAWFRTPQAGWWYWWNNDIEANAWCLRALIRLEPKSDVAPRLVKWLLNNRHNGYYWRSTRDTTMVIAAMSDFVVASGEGAADYTLTLDLDDGAVVKEVKINKDNFFTFDNRLVVEGVALAGGRHKLKITKDGPGALYFNTYLRYFTKEDHITAAGHELKVDRRYYRLEQIPYEVTVEGSEGQELKEKRLRYQRVPLKDGDSINSGDLVQVELKVASDNTYTYLAFEDMKPAGCEAVELRSGAQGQEGFYSYMELRDEKVVFFVSSLQQGEHLLRYRLRAEVPGTFHALPSVLYGMYVPELRANSEEHVVTIVD